MRLGSILCPPLLRAGKCPVRGLQDDAEIEEDLDPAVLKSLDKAVAALALVPDRAAAKEVLFLHDLSHFTLLPNSWWGRPFQH